MDYITRQFINLTKKFRKEVPKLISLLSHDLQQHTKAVNEFAKTADKRNQQNLPVPLPVIAELKIPESEKTQRGEEHDQDRKIQIWLTVGTWLAFIAAGFYATVAALQWKDFKETLSQGQIVAKNSRIQAAQAWRAANAATQSLKDQQRFFQINQRPYLVLDSRPGFVAPLGADKPVGVTVYFRNIGKSPAMNVVMAVHLKKFYPDPLSIPRPVGLKKWADFVGSSFADLDKEVAHARAENSRYKAEHDLAPNDRIFTTAHDITLSRDEVSLIQRNDALTIYFVGVLTYRDTSGTPYQTEFCQYFFGSDVTVWHVCDTRNTIQ